MKKKICFIVNVDYVVNHFLINHLRSLSKIYDITVVGNFDRLRALEEKRIAVKIHMIPFEREIYVNLLMQYIEEENERIKQEERKSKR